MRNSLFILLLFIVQTSFANEFCIYNITDLSPSLTVTISKDSKGIYTYNYNLTANEDSKFPLGMLWIKFPDTFNEINAPKGWKVSRSKEKMLQGLGEKGKYIQWSRNKKENLLLPGQELSGFTVTSHHKPSLTMAKVAALQDWGSPQVYSKVKKETGKPCPGVWDEVSSNTDAFARVLTLGPSSDNQVSLPMFTRSSSKSAWAGSYDENPSALHILTPFDKKDIEILIVSDDTLNVKDIDTTSLRFGRGEAKVKSAKKISNKNQKFSSTTNIKLANERDALLLSFNPHEVNPLCDVDLALFLTGKTTTGKTFFSGVAIKKNPCTEENWKDEAKKILKKESDMKHSH